MADKEKITLTSLCEKVRRGGRISMLALYDYPMAVLAQEADIDAVIVGDSVAMNVYGYEDTLSADMPMMLRHTQAVRRGGPELFIIGDMPYMSYQPSVELALDNANRFLFQGQADAVKLEGGRDVLETVRALVKNSVPVVGHLGLLPQSAAIQGGFKAQGREAESALDIVEQAKMLEQAGIGLLILECIPPAVSQAIVERIKVPVIGIGSGPACHGQVQIVYDILGLYPGRTAKFVKKFADLKGPLVGALRDYTEQVRAGIYPADEHCYPMKPGQEEAFLRRMREKGW